MPDETSYVVDPTSPLGARDRALLVRAQRFLVNIADPKIGAIAAHVGYSAAEHTVGWSLWTRAAGANRPFDHYLSAAEQTVAAGSDEVKHAIKQLDGFENVWFTRARNAIRRFVKEDREAVEAAFFDNLVQQPEGPAVVGSVSLLLDRLAGLVASDVPGARDAHASLVRKGLDAAEVARVQALLDTARALAPTEAPRVPDAEQQAAAADQREALADLRLWYTDWADTLRDELGYHDAVRVGIRRPRGGRGRSAEPDPDDDDPAGDGGPDTGS